MTPGRPLAVVAFGAWLAAGCGLAQLQTARTEPRGQTRTTIAVSRVANNERYAYVASWPVDIMVRHGLTDRADFGVRLFFGAGLLGDLKWNLLSPSRRTALSLSAGLGGAVDPGGGGTSGAATIVHVPVTVALSHDVTPALTPYAAFGYGSYWIFNYGESEPGVRYAARRGTGDGLAMLHAGVQLGQKVILEYTLAYPLVNDPGDRYAFTTNHLFSIGLR